VGSAHGHELEDLWPLVEAARERWEATAAGSVRGRPHVFGEIQHDAAVALYDLVRDAKPDRVVETGVCNGLSTTVILRGLECNGRGRLWSLDLPEYAGLPTGEHWEGKGGSVIPPGFEPGWLVPASLRHRWHLAIGRSQERLEEVFAEADPVDLFVHDSEHSYECMTFELSLARRHVQPGGWIVADDVGRTTAFAEQTVGLQTVAMGHSMAAARVPPAAWPTRRRGRPTLTVSVTTRDAEHRLGRVLEEARAFADEVIVGVDAHSTDATFDVACENADAVYSFIHSDEPSPARLLAVEQVRTDWVLVLDDDEGVDAAFPDVLPELLTDERYTHWWLLRRWVVGLDPCRHLEVQPWFPDFQLRLFRADPRLVWKPYGVHTGTQVMGPSGVEARAALLHYEPVLLDDAARAAKLERYRKRGSSAAHDRWFVRAADTPGVPTQTGPLSAPPRAARRATRVDSEPVDLDLRPRQPPWNAEVDVRLSPTASPGELLFGTATARNSGGLAWVPTRDAVRWPVLNLCYRTRGSDGALLDVQGLPTEIPRWVDPGDSATMVCCARAPSEPGDYVLEWQLLSAEECWFTDCGAQPARTPLRVRA
jgi:predicted O-methyltransferase YrrM